jgi:hypothetical protein
VYAAGPPTEGGADLFVARAARRVFEGTAAWTAHPEHRSRLREYLSDLGRPYGVTPREPYGGHSYGEMARALIAATVRPDEPVDLLVLALAVPDIRPGRATATYLSHLCPGDPLAFAVCDQGAAAGFTALRLAREYARTGACRRALVIAVEQATLHYEPVAPVPLPARHAAVALLCGDAGPARLGPVSFNEPLPDRDVLVLGNGLSSVDDPTGKVRHAPEGQPYTGVWWELVGELADPSGHRVVAADRDPVLGYTCTATVEVDLSAEPVGGVDVRVELGAS